MKRTLMYSSLFLLAHFILRTRASDGQVYGWLYWEGWQIEIWQLAATIGFLIVTLAIYVQFTEEGSTKHE